MVSGMSGRLRRTLGEIISIETIQSGGLWIASADINQLENALLNLALMRGTRCDRRAADGRSG
jgi:hypothetical protein